MVQSLKSFQISVAPSKNFVAAPPTTSKKLGSPIPIPPPPPPQKKRLRIGVVSQPLCGVDQLNPVLPYKENTRFFPARETGNLKINTAEAIVANFLKI